MRPSKARLGASSMVMRSFRGFVFFLLLGFLAGCTKQADLPDIVVAASSHEEFIQFRSALGTQFSAGRLQDFDTATRELQLDAMNRNIAAADAREAEMLRAANGKTVHAVTVLGWGARQARFLREIAEITRMLDHDRAQPPTESVTRRVGSEKEVLAQLERNLADTERHLAELQATPSNKAAN
jgi:hypothetical protein